MSSTQDTTLAEVTCFYANGQLMEQEFWNHGYLDGERKEWFENGLLHRQEFYRRGILEGERKIWHENGKLWTHEFHEGGGNMEVLA